MWQVVEHQILLIMCFYLVPLLLLFGVLLDCGLVWHLSTRINYIIILFILQVVYERVAPLCSSFVFVVFGFYEQSATIDYSRTRKTLLIRALEVLWLSYVVVEPVYVYGYRLIYFCFL